MSESEKRRWTEEDIADAKAVRQLYPRAKEVERSALNTVVFIIQPGKKPEGVIVGVIRDAFPGLKPGETATLDEILEAEND